MKEVQLGGKKIKLDVEVEFAPVTLLVGHPLYSTYVLDVLYHTLEESGKRAFILDVHRHLVKLAECYGIGVPELTRGLEMLRKMNKLANRNLLTEFDTIVNEELTRMEKTIKELELKVNVVDLLPVRLEIDDGRIYWEEGTGIGGTSLCNLPASLAAAMVATGLRYAYAAAKDEPVYLFIGEPELHASPLQAFFLGHLAAVLTKRAQERGAKLFVVAFTHSIDFIRGATRKWTKIYLVERAVGEHNEVVVRTSPIPEEQAYWIPYFVEAAILSTATVEE